LNTVREIFLRFPLPRIGGYEDVSDANRIKQNIIDIARTEAELGAHYLWGAAGNRPGEGDGATYRPKHAQLHANVPNLDGMPEAGKFRGTPYVPTLYAAWVNSHDQGRLACAGRCGLKEVQELPLALDMPVKQALALKLNALTQDQIDELQSLRTTSAEYRWPRPNGTLERSTYPSTIWGECCIGKRHFDCIGLVNYCFSAALNRVWHYGIENFTTPAYAKAGGIVEVRISAAQPCDIVTFGADHIGIVTESKTVVEAKDPASGVTEHPIGNRPWQQCWRLPASTWRIGR